MYSLGTWQKQQPLIQEYTSREHCLDKVGVSGQSLENY